MISPPSPNHLQEILQLRTDLPIPSLYCLCKIYSPWSEGNYFQNIDSTSFPRTIHLSTGQTVYYIYPTEFADDILPAAQYTHVPVNHLLEKTGNGILGNDPVTKFISRTIHQNDVTVTLRARSCAPQAQFKQIKHNASSINRNKLNHCCNGCSLLTAEFTIEISLC